MESSIKSDTHPLFKRHAYKKVKERWLIKRQLLNKKEY